ncbi:hypothetical protein HWV62_45097 [Athelia sp. TMB]|nr:hypothetical protein HWV62_45097 [Athelia sp. TMB]
MSRNTSSTPQYNPSSPSSRSSRTSAASSSINVLASSRNVPSPRSGQPQPPASPVSQTVINTAASQQRQRQIQQRSRELDEAAQALAARERELNQREEDLDNRADELEHRAAQVDQRDTYLNTRLQRFQTRSDDMRRRERALEEREEAVGRRELEVTAREEELAFREENEEYYDEDFEEDELGGLADNLSRISVSGASSFASGSRTAISSESSLEDDDRPESPPFSENEDHRRYVINSPVAQGPVREWSTAGHLTLPHPNSWTREPADGAPPAPPLPESLLRATPSAAEIRHAIQNTHIPDDWPWWVVFKGVRTGIFPFWSIAASLTHRLGPATHQRYSSRQVALEAYRGARARGEVHELEMGVPYYYGAPR